MFRVTASSLESYFGFDPQRKPDLERLDGLIRDAAPNLKRYFHEGTPAGEAGMRMKMIGYGRFGYAVKFGKESPWPVIGVALQKNYISVYFAITKDGAPVIDSFRGKLGELRSGVNNFSFVRFADLNAAAVSALVAEAAEVYKADPQNPVRCMQGL
jgi:hypothetical protein